MVSSAGGLLAQNILLAAPTASGLVTHNILPAVSVTASKIIALAKRLLSASRDNVSTTLYALDIIGRVALIRAVLEESSPKQHGAASRTIGNQLQESLQEVQILLKDLEECRNHKGLWLWLFPGDPEPILVRLRTASARMNKRLDLTLQLKDFT